MSTGGEKGSATTKTPADFLKSIRGRPVVVKLNSGVDYRGILACLDGYMNIAMEQTEEYVNGQLKNKYGDAFIRGNNVLYISTSKRTLAEGAQLSILPRNKIICYHAIYEYNFMQIKRGLASEYWVNTISIYPRTESCNEPLKRVLDLKINALIFNWNRYYDIVSEVDEISA